MIEVRDLSIGAGTFSHGPFNFSVPEGAYGMLMGKTGSGKTTLLETLCGLLRPRAGRILVEGADVTNRKPAERGLGYVPQDTVLFNSLTVREHLSLALEIRRWPPDAVGRRVEELSRLLDLAHLLKRRPEGLSGGERQRVALGRALSFKPRLLLLDEPLNALDKTTWEEMCGLLRRVQKETGVTALHVTHDTEEAERLGDLVIRI